MSFLSKLKDIKEKRSLVGTAGNEPIPNALFRTFEVFRTNDLTPPKDFVIDRSELLSHIKRRKELFTACISDKGRQQEEIEKCREDIVYWCNNWAWTYDPRFLPGISTLPFMLFPRQEEYLRWRHERRLSNEQGLIEKSRDMGVSWLNMLAQTHPFLFEREYKGAIGSRKEMLVDRKGDPDCLFEKIRFLLSALPPWMRPPVQDAYLKIINLESGAVITGEAGDNIGRGGRSSCYDIDEADFLARPQQVDAAVSQNCPVIFWTSTPNIWNPRSTFAEKISRGQIPVFYFDWKDDPRKDDAWYQKQLDTLDPITVASEIDRNREANVTNNVIPMKWVRAAVNFNLARVKAMRTGVDISDGGRDFTVAVSGAFPRAQYVDVFQIPDVDPIKTADAVTEKIRGYASTLVVYDAIGVGAGCGGRWKQDPTVTFKQHKFVASERPTKVNEDEYYYYSEFDRYGDEMFANKKAEAWWTARQRFWKTYRAKHEGAKYPDHELVSIPDCPELIKQIPQVLWKKDNQGRIQIEPKKDLDKSPDHADALIMFLWQHTENYSPDWISNF